MPNEIKYLPVEEFRDLGYLQEVNRQFLHPLGLALSIEWDAAGHAFLSGIWDFRDDLEGLRFAPGMLDGAAKTRADRIRDERDQKAAYRLGTLGWIEQPFEFNARLDAEAAAAAKDPKMIASMEEAEADLAAGRTVPLDEVRAELDRDEDV